MIAGLFFLLLVFFLNPTLGLLLFLIGLLGFGFGFGYLY